MGRATLFVLLICWAWLPVGTRAAEIDPGFVGHWELSYRDAAGRQQVRAWEFRADGSFTFHDVTAGHSGSFTAQGGRWTTRPAAGGWMDKGSYALLGADRLQLTGIFGTTLWTRPGAAPAAAQEPLFATQAVGGQEVPANLPLLLAQAYVEIAQPWRADAVPVGLTVDLETADGEIAIRMRFVSPADTAGLWVDLTRFARSQRQTPETTWSQRAIPGLFIDLPVALRTARPGSQPRAKTARLSVWEDGQVLWGFSFAGRSTGTVVGAMSGAIIEDLGSAYIDDYNRQWAEAAEGLRRLFRRPGAGSGGDFDPAALSCAMKGGVWDPLVAPGCHTGSNKGSF